MLFESKEIKKTAVKRSSKLWMDTSFTYRCFQSSKTYLWALSHAGTRSGHCHSWRYTTSINISLNILYTYLLARRMIASLLSPKTVFLLRGTIVLMIIDHGQKAQKLFHSNLDEIARLFVIILHRKNLQRYDNHV